MKSILFSASIVLGIMFPNLLKADLVCRGQIPLGSGCSPNTLSVVLKISDPENLHSAYTMSENFNDCGGARFLSQGLITSFWGYGITRKTLTENAAGFLPSPVKAVPPHLAARLFLVEPNPGHVLSGKLVLGENGKGTPIPIKCK